MIIDIWVLEKVQFREQ